jgi:hypothetical protein
VAMVVLGGVKIPRRSRGAAATRTVWRREVTKCGRVFSWKRTACLIYSFFLVAARYLRIFHTVEDPIQRPLSDQRLGAKIRGQLELVVI